jgi:hypothetical protein
MRTKARVPLILVIGACVVWAGDPGECLGAAERPYFDRAPYLQSLTSHAVVIMSQSSAALKARLDFGLPGAMAPFARDQAATNDHHFAVTGLAPATDYEYQVAHGDYSFDPVIFRTLPEAGPGEQSAVTFAVLGDSGFDDGSGDPPQEAIARLLEAMAPRPDFLLHTGDVVTPQTEFLSIQDRYFDVYRALIKDTCVYPAMGNHDCYGGLMEPWLAAFDTPGGDGWPQETFYSFDAGNAHVVALNMLDGNLEDEQIPWLREDLAATNQPWKIAFLHHPPYGTGLHGSNEKAKALVVPILEEFGVDIVFSGHNHTYERFYPLAGDTVRDGWQDPSFVAPRGVAYVTSGGGGAPTVPRSVLEDVHLSAHYLQINHYLEVRVTAARLDVAAIDLHGDVIDRFNIRKDVPREPFRFVRGDANNSGAVGIADAITVLTFLFAGNKALCRAAGDVDGDGTVAIGDAVYLLTYLFAGGDPPPAPFPHCGSVEEADDAGCVRRCD